MRALNAIESGLLRLQWLAAAAKFEVAMRRHELALKAGFNPGQPRDDHGRWTDAGGGEGADSTPSPANGQGLNDPRVISDATPDNNWKPDAQYAANETEKSARDRANGHHYIPRAVYRNPELNLPSKTQKVFEEEGKTGRLFDDRTNRYNADHRVYNTAVQDEFRRFLTENNIHPERMTPDQARSFLGEVLESKDPRIRNFNMRIQIRELIQRVLRRPPPIFRGNE
jgi:hypothetical protein